MGKIRPGGWFRPTDHLNLACDVLKNLKQPPKKSESSSALMNLEASNRGRCLRFDLTIGSDK